MPNSDKLTDEDPMPVFPIKAKDNLAPDTIRHYGMLCRERGLHEQHTQVILAGSEIDAWRSRNPDALKDPDHKHVAARGSVSLPNENASDASDEADDAIHIAVDHGRKTACGGDARQRNTVGPRDPRPNGAEGCWMCLLVAEELTDAAALSAAPSIGEDEAKALTVNEGVALMQAWCRYLGVDDYTTAIPSTDFKAGFLAAIAAYRGVGEAK